jgi:hypothetical protein
LKIVVKESLLQRGCLKIALELGLARHEVRIAQDILDKLGIAELKKGSAKLPT